MITHVKNCINNLVLKGKSLLSCSSCSCSYECTVWKKILLALALGLVIGIFVV